MSGRVAGLSAKAETLGEAGLPKRPVPVLQLTPAGAEGDFNRYRTHQLNGDPDSAVLLLTEDILEALRAEGWPVEAGHLGENVLLDGIPAATLTSGQRIKLGTALVELSRACDPCTELYGLPYVGRARGPEFVRTLHGRRGWYARVVEAGTVTVGDAAELATPGSPR